GESCLGRARRHAGAGSAGGGRGAPQSGSGRCRERRARPSQAGGWQGRPAGGRRAAGGGRAGREGGRPGREPPCRRQGGGRRGAPRFTTDLFARREAARDVKIRIASVTAGIRGTDIWGKSDDRRDLVCLIEGKVEVSRGSDAPVTLDQPLDFYVAPKDGSAPT